MVSPPHVLPCFKRRILCGQCLPQLPNKVPTLCRNNAIGPMRSLEVQAMPALHSRGAQGLSPCIVISKWRLKSKYEVLVQGIEKVFCRPGTFHGGRDLIRVWKTQGDGAPCRNNIPHQHIVTCDDKWHFPLQSVSYTTWDVKPTDPLRESLRMFFK